MAYDHPEGYKKKPSGSKTKQEHDLTMWKKPQRYHHPLILMA